LSKFTPKNQNQTDNNLTYTTTKKREKDWKKGVIEFAIAWIN
jgi:hypothetical protein